MHNLTPAQTVAAVRAAYPEPVRSCDAITSREYCVGTAFCRFVSVAFDVAPFVNLIDLSLALYYQNPALTHRDAMRHAAMIINHNDCGRFAGAWEALERALGAQA